MRDAAAARSFPGGRLWLVAAVAMSLVAFASGSTLRPPQAWVALLVSSFFFLTVSLGAMVFLAMMAVSNAGWHTAFKRVPESMAAYLPLGALGTLAVLRGIPWLYHWAQPEATLHDPLLQAKAPYLNTDFFAVRMIVVLVLWVSFGMLMRRRSLPQDDDSRVRHSRRTVALSAAFLVVFPFSFSMASIDWLMSLDPHWASSIFGLYNIAGLLSAAVAAISVGVIVLRRRGALPLTNEAHLHDLGKLLFGFSTVWAYLWFCQYLLIWYTNFPEENTHYLARLQGNVSILFFLNPAVSWALPFVILLGRSAKRSEKTLLAASALVLAGRWLDIHLLVAPAVFPGYAGIGGLDIALFLGFAAAFLLTTDWALRQAPLAAQEDVHAVKRPHGQPIPVPTSSVEE